MQIPVFVIMQEEEEIPHTMLIPLNIASHGGLRLHIDNFVPFLSTELLLDPDYLFLWSCHWC